MTLGDSNTDAELNSVSTEDLNSTIHWVPAGSTASEINSVIANADDGDTVRLENGLYTISNPITDQGKNGITLEADSMFGATIQVEQNTQISAIELDGANHWEIRYIEIDGQGSNQTDGGDGNTQCGMYVEQSDYFNPHHNYIHDTVYANIRVAADGGNVYYANIHNNICEKTYASAPADNISLKANTSYENANWTIANNHCIDCNHQAIETSARASYGVVANNIVDNSNNIGIAVHDGENVSVIGNNVRNSAAGITIVGTSYVAVGNTIKNSDAAAMKVGNTSRGNGKCVAIGNMIQSTDDHGLVVDAATCRVIGNSIIDSSTASNKAAIRVLKDDCDIISNYIENGNFGIDLKNGASALVESNRVRGVDNDGITIWTDNNHLIGNIIENGGNRGVLINGGSQNMAVGNLSRNNSNQGYLMANAQGDCKDNRLESNRAIGNSGGFEENGETRTVFNGIGFNSGDPSSTGEWNGNGFNGLIVRDTSNNNTYLYNNGAWSQIASS